MKLKRFLLNHYRVILISGACLGLCDSLITNYLIAGGATELNPIVAPIAGTLWLIVVKTVYPLAFLGIIELLKLKTRRRTINIEKAERVTFVRSIN
jgi:hypothetical protein